MTQEAQRLAIAKARGWTGIIYNSFLRDYFGHMPNTDRDKYALPDYLNDRNVMMEVVKSIPRDQHDRYLTRLFNILIKARGDEGVSKLDTHTAEPKYCAEAYLKTLNLWIE